MQPLWCCRVVDQAHSHRVSLEGLKASKFDHTWAGAKDAVGADIVIDIYNR